MVCNFAFKRLTTFLSSFSKAGGSSSDINLFDLRMTDASTANRSVQVYRPSSLTPQQDVSVSGIDLSRDRKELLVSFESDQIYTFPVFPRNGKGLGPTVDEMRDMSVERCSGRNDPVRELASYGAHLNRLTFLKVCCSGLSVRFHV